MIGRKNKGKLKQNNAGMSFIELIVVIGIIAVMAGMLMYGVSLLVNADSKKASKNLYQQISDLRNETLAQTGTWYGEITRSTPKGQYYFTIYRDDASGTRQVDRQALGSRITITARGAAETLITDTTSVKIYFNPGTGTVKSIKHGTSGADLRDTTNKFYFDVASNSGESYELTLWINTGKISADY